MPATLSQSPRIRVSPDEPNPTHHISLDDGVELYGLNIDQGGRGIQEIPQTASTLRFTGGGGKFGDYEPSISHLEQRTWSGGRGGEYYSDDPSKYFDAHHTWTLSPGILMPASECIHARGLRNQDSHSRAKMPTSTDVKHFFWLKLTGSTLAYATKFVASASYDADACYLYIRRVGNPATLTFKLWSNSGDAPNAVLKTITVATDTITDLEGVFYKFDWTGVQALVSGTSYWVSVAGATTDNADNHWLVGVSQTINRVTGTDVATSVDGSVWATASTGRNLYFRVVDADIKRTFKYFLLDGALYAVDKRANSTASHLYINGTRGKATSATGGTLTDTNNTDPVNSNGNTSIYIIRGTGFGQARGLVGGTAPSTGLTLDAVWDTTPDTTSEYIIYATDLWKELTGTGITGVVNSVVVCNNIAYLAQGPAINIRRLRFNPAAGPPHAHEYADDGTNKADHLALAHKDTKPVVWRGLNANSSVSRADGVAWGVDLTFGTAILVGDLTWPITKMLEYDDGLAVMKPDSVWLETATDIFEKLPVDLDRLVDITNGQAALAKDLFLYFNFAHSVEKYYSGTLSDIGPSRGIGLPGNRRGIVSHLEGGVGLMFVAVDAGSSGYSSVLATDSVGYCEVFRAPMAGERIQAMAWQPTPGTFPRLWIECNGDMWAIATPEQSLNPQYNAAFPFAHECSLITSTFDMGSATLPKFLKELSVSTRNLFELTDIGAPTDIYIGELQVDYQTDSDIGTPAWTNISRVLTSPHDNVTLNFGDVKAARFRFRIYSSYQAGVNGTLVPWIQGTVLKGFARTPIKYQYILRVKTSDWAVTLSGKPDLQADDLVDWLKKVSVSARKITMRSIWRQLDGKVVVVEPPNVLRDGIASIGQHLGRLGWTGTLPIVLREV